MALPTVDESPLRSSVDRAFRRTWVARIYALIVLTLAWLAPGFAQAAPWVNGGQATYFYHTGVQLDANPNGTARTYSFRTTNLTNGADPIMHVIRVTGFVEVGRNDDYPGLGLNARVDVTVTPSTAGTYSIYVRNGKGSESGKGDVQKDGVTMNFATQRQFGGRVINIGMSGTLTYETQIIPSGCPDTFILGLDANGKIVAKDDQGGIANGSRFTSSTTRKVVLGAFSESTNGAANLLVNKTSPDTDDDGLCDQLETELGTCKSVTCVINGQTVSGKDTDRDGLEDKAEVFGLDDPAGFFDQELSRWGARPLHKDVFVELDYTDAFATNPFTAADGRAAARFLAQGAANDVLNPDGYPGIRLHTDIGIDDTIPGSTEFGNFYGTNQSVHHEDGTGEASWNDRTDFSRMRINVFHHGLFGAGGGGNAGIPGGYFVWFGNASDRRIQGGYVHELGHNLGLQHYGHANWGPYQCKPNYRSLMNYAYEYDDVTGFSSSSFYNTVINPSAVSESNLFGPVDVSFLAKSPFYYNEVDNGNYRMVDWNRDGRMEPPASSALVRAPVTWGPGTGCDGFTNGTQDVAAGIWPFATDAPKITKFFNHLYLFYVNAAGAIQYRHGTIPGADSSGSCNSLANCVTWSAAASVPAIGTVTGLAVATWKSSVFFVYRNTTGQLYSKSSGTIGGDGTIQSWSGDTFAGTATTSPELSIMYVNPAFFNGQTEVAVIFAHQSGGFQQIWGPSPNGAWQAGSVIGTDNLALSGAPVPPTVASWPNRGGVNHAAYGTSCGTFVDAFNNVRFYCYDKATNRWQNLSTQVFGATPPVSNIKTGLAYHVPRINTGAPLVDTVYGQFYLVVPGSSSDLRPRMYMSNASSTSPLTSGFTFATQGFFGNSWDGVLPGSGFTIYEDETISAPKAAAIYFYDNADPSLATSVMRLHGFADGSFNANLKDGNDWQIMEHGTCLSLAQYAVCGPNIWGF